MFKKLKSKSWQVIFVATVIFVGFFYRLWFISLTDPKLYYESLLYFVQAQKTLDGILPVDCCLHGSGYPLFISVILSIFGKDNLYAVRLSQGIIDTLSGLLVYGSSVSVFGQIAGLLSLIFYMFNPFTASYSGLFMTEIINIHLVSWIIFLVTRKCFPKKPLMWFAAGIIVGANVLMKPGFLLESCLVISGLWLVMSLKNHTYVFGPVVLIGFFLISSISVFIYKTSFDRWSIIPPYSHSIGFLLYLNYYLIPMPELLMEYQDQPAKWTYATNEFYRWRYTNPKPIIELNNKYTHLFIQELPFRWKNFVRNYLRNFFLLWDKRHLFAYTDVFYPQDKYIVRTINMVYLLVSIYGFVIYLQIKKSINYYLLMVTFSIFIYIGIGLPMIANLSRYSLPFYPLLSLWAGSGILKLIKK